MLARPTVKPRIRPITLAANRSYVHFPAELHFVHIRDDGRAAVVGVLIETGDKPNKTLQTIIDNTPSEPGHNSTDVIVNPNDLLPAQRNPYYA